jgi:hypothetical protein
VEDVWYQTCYGCYGCGGAKTNVKMGSALDLNTSRLGWRRILTRHLADCKEGDWGSGWRGKGRYRGKATYSVVMQHRPVVMPWIDGLTTPQRLLQPSTQEEPPDASPLPPPLSPSDGHNKAIQGYFMRNCWLCTTPC